MAEEEGRDGSGGVGVFRNHNTACVIDPDTHTASEVNPISGKHSAPIRSRHTNIRSRAACISEMMSGRSGVDN